MSEGLVLCLPFDGNASDKSGFDNNGQNYGATITADRFGNEQSAFYFNGSDAYIEVPHSASLNVQEISMAMWVKPTEFKSFSNTAGTWPKYAGPISKDLNPSANWSGFSTTVQHGRLRLANSFGRIKVGDVWRDNTINLEEWSFLVFMIQNGVLSLYKNGVLLEVDKQFKGLKMTESGKSIVIGRSIWYPSGTKLDAYFTGIIDDILIYNRGLTLQEITFLYKGPSMEDAKLTTTPAEPCFGELVHISAQTEESNVSFSWTVGDEKIKTDKNFIELKRNSETSDNMVQIGIIQTKKEDCLPPVSKSYTLDLAFKNCDTNELSKDLPTAFTPNHDGINDHFDLSILSKQEPEKIEFYNRWGNQVITLFKPNLNWDGFIYQQPATIGSYNYIITFSSGAKKNGIVTLLR